MLISLAHQVVHHLASACLGGEAVDVDIERLGLVRVDGLHLPPVKAWCHGLPRGVNKFAVDEDVDDRVGL